MIIISVKFAGSVLTLHSHTANFYWKCLQLLRPSVPPLRTLRAVVMSRTGPFLYMTFHERKFYFSLNEKK